jgi:hypothetical protein
VRQGLQDQLAVSIRAPAKERPTMTGQMPAMSQPCPLGSHWVSRATPKIAWASNAPATLRLRA